ncbi:MAG: fumarylacetoacetate hydrolase family protein [Hyphomonas sp.]
MLPIANSDEVFPVRRIYCVGRNYAEHVREMGRDPDRNPPFFFEKPRDAIVANGSEISYAMGTTNLHHEIELVVAIGKAGRNIRQEDALDHVLGYCVGNDLTRRDLQLAARDKGLPWDTGKSFDQSAPCTELLLASDIGHPTAGRIWLEIDGELRQQGDIAQMIWKTDEIVSILSSLFLLKPGDIIMTGTPAGIGPVEPGQTMKGSIDGFPVLTTTIRGRK